MSIAAALWLLGAASGDPGLAVFDRLLGRCWTGEIASGAQDVQCFESVYDGAHVRGRHEVIAQGRVVYAGETVYTREEDDLTFVYLNSLGGIGRGTVEPSSDGLCFAGEVRGSSDAALVPLASCWTWTDDGYRAVSTAPTTNTTEYMAKRD